MILDEEVFAVILAIIVVASVLAAAQLLRPNVTEPFIAIGLLNEHCKIGEYPQYVAEGSNVTLCIYLYNYLGKPVYYEVVYKIGTSKTLPTNTIPSPEKPIMEWKGVLMQNESITFLVKVPVYAPNPRARNATLIFELWIFDTKSMKWIYTGRWVHLHVKLVKG